MNLFDKDYSNFYDLIYKDKKYAKEMLSIKKVIRKYYKKPKNLLEFGCGTGNYSNLFSKLDLDVLGVDLSSHMLNIAKKKYGKNKRLNFLKSDINKLKIKKSFDIISALFYTLGYQTRDYNIKNFFKTSYKHLKKNGILIFDFWYKPAVLNLKPSIKVKYVENKKYAIFRITHPEWYRSKDIINVNFKILIFNKINKKFKIVREVHKIRYFDLNKIRKYLKIYKFKLLESLEIMSDKKISPRTWGVLVVARKM